MTRRVPLAAFLALAFFAAPFALADEAKKPAKPPTVQKKAESKPDSAEPSYPPYSKRPAYVTTPGTKTPPKAPQSPRVVTIQPDFPVPASGTSKPQTTALTSPETELEMEDNEMEIASDNECEVGLLSDNALLSDNTENQIASDNRMLSENKLLTGNEGGVKVASENEATLLSHNKAKFLSGIRLLSGISIHLDITVNKAAAPAENGKAKARRKQAREAREKTKQAREAQPRPSSARPTPNTRQRSDARPQPYDPSQRPTARNPR